MLVTIDTQQLHPDGDVMPLCSVVNKNRERVQGGQSLRFRLPRCRIRLTLALIAANPLNSPSSHSTTAFKLL